MGTINWSNEAIKVAAVCAGIAMYFATRIPQTAETLTPWLASQGYSQLRIEGPVERCGRSRSRYQFQARKADGKPVIGDVCMGDYQWEYRLTLTEQPGR